MAISGNWIQIYLFCLLVFCSLSCQDSNCVTCNTYIGDSNGTLVQTCSECISGYNLKNQACEQDKGLIIGIAIGAAMAVVAQMVCYIYCKIVYGNRNKKNVDITLEDIYKDEIDADGQIVSQSRKTEHKMFPTNKCGVCNKQETLIKTNCGHYFHHQCFKEKMIEISDSCPHPNCIRRKALSLIDMLCIKCLKRQRSIPLETITHFQRFHQYVCFMCKMKTKKEEDAKKWWRRCC